MITIWALIIVAFTPATGPQSIADWNHSDHYATQAQCEVQRDKFNAIGLRPVPAGMAEMIAVCQPRSMVHQ